MRSNYNHEYYFCEVFKVWQYLQFSLWTISYSGHDVQQLCIANNV